MNRISVFVLPVLVFGMLALGGCSRTETVKIPAGGVYLSTSAGGSFAQSVASDTAKDKNIANFDLGKIHRSIKDPSVVFMAAGKDGMVVSHDDGVNWSAIVIPLAGVIDVTQTKAGVWLAAGVDASAQGVVMRSTDDGKTWQGVLTLPVTQQKKQFQIIKGGSTGPASVVALEVDMNHADLIWAGTNDGSIFAGEQSGKTWRKVIDITSRSSMITGDKTGAGVLRFIPSSTPIADTLIITRDGRLLQLKDAAITEIRVPEQLDAATPFGVNVGSQKIISAAYVPSFPNALLVGTSTAVVVTRDAGKTWTALKMPLDASKTLKNVSVAVSPTNIGRMLVAIDGIIFRSEDSGASWNSTDLPATQAGAAPTGYSVTDLSINPKNASRVLIVVKPPSA